MTSNDYVKEQSLHVSTWEKQTEPPNSNKKHSVYIHVPDQLTSLLCNLWCIPWNLQWKWLLSGSLWVLVLFLFLFFKQMCLASVFTGLVNLCAGIFGRSQVYFLYIYIHASVFKWKHLSFQCQWANLEWESSIHTTHDTTYRCGQHNARAYASRVSAT